MNRSLNNRTIWSLGLAVLLAGCASKPLIEPAQPPATASLDDGINYYSASVNEDETLTADNRQWTTDEEGNRVYLLNRIPRGARTDYYVGDIRYALAFENRHQIRTGAGVRDRPYYVTPEGVPLYDYNVRGPDNRLFYPARRGRITYLPGRTQAPAQGSGSDQGSTPTTSNSNSQPRQPNFRPPRRSSTPPPTSKPPRRIKPDDDSRQRDR